MKATGNPFNPFTEELQPYLEGNQNVKPFQLLWDQMGSGQETIFGQALCNMSGDEAAIKTIDVSELQKDKVKELYVELFRDYDVPLDAEPQMLSIVQMS